MKGRALQTARPADAHGELHDGGRVMREWADRVIGELGAMDDDRLTETARLATELEWQAFRLRGACASEMRRRVTARLSGGRGQRDDAREGVTARMIALAGEVGVSARTLYEDALIYETFVVDNNSFSREVYRLALTASDPRAAVEMYANRKADDPQYSTQDYRRDISELNRGKTTPYAPAPGLRRLTFDLPPRAVTALKLLCDRLQCDDEEAVARALYHAARSVEDGNDI